MNDLSRQTTDTLLAALRKLQQIQERGSLDELNSVSEVLRSDDGDDWAMLDEHEIDDLCEAINFGRIQQAPTGQAAYVAALEQLRDCVADALDAGEVFGLSLENLTAQHARCDAAKSALDGRAHNAGG